MVGFGVKFGLGVGKNQRQEVYKILKQEDHVFIWRILSYVIPSVIGLLYFVAEITPDIVLSGGGPVNSKTEIIITFDLWKSNPIFFFSLRSIILVPSLIFQFLSWRASIPLQYLDFPFDRTIVLLLLWTSDSANTLKSVLWSEGNAISGDRIFLLSFLLTVMVL